MIKKISICERNEERLSRNIENYAKDSEKKIYHRF